ncbi:Mitochondrial distribution and morphology protein 34 [Hypsizygus marmoreus]|uniref:Mitochondrial distribution and morphology protein 34 n=1 Tax=Hypsizygus marmoreus TaxID=39966 RepID=A0A369JGS7_HYPMA|nr:Mitochondrial distribution and morphology protein 34 [Hypsizygus marmoreus]
MSFTFNWPRFSDQFHYDAIQMLNTALNKGNKPPIIADRIEVVELEMGTQPPELEIRDIGDLTVDQFRGIFRLTYSGDAHLVLKTKVQANPLNHKQPDIHLMAGSRGMLAAKEPLVVPMLLRLSHFKLNSYVVLVVSKQKGITLVFKTDPLQHVDINSTFDSIAVIQKFIQREIEGQLRQMFREDLPGIIHRLSQQWVKAKVETPYVQKPPPPSVVRQQYTFETRSTSEMTFQSMPPSPYVNGIHPSLPRRPQSLASASVRSSSYPKRPRSASGFSSASASKSRPPKPQPPPNLDHVSFPDLENFDPTYGLRPEGLPTKSVFRGFSNLFTPNKGLADLAEDDEEEEDEYDDDDDGAASFDIVNWDYTVPDSNTPSIYDDAQESVAPDSEYETIPAVGGGTITRPRILHSQSMIQPSFGALSQSNASASSSKHRPPLQTPGLMSRRSSGIYNPYSGESRGQGRPGNSSTIDGFHTAPLFGSTSRRPLTPDSLSPQPSRSSSGQRLSTSTPPTEHPMHDDDHYDAYHDINARNDPATAAMYLRPPPAAPPTTAPSSRRPSISSGSTFDHTFATSGPPSNHSPLSMQNSSLHHTMNGNPQIVLRPGLNHTIHQLSTLSYSNHTLSPYTRSLQHFTVRSVPPRSAPANLASSMERQPVKARRKRTFRLGGAKKTGEPSVGATAETGEGEENGDGAAAHKTKPPGEAPEFDVSDMDRYFRTREELVAVSSPPAPPPRQLSPSNVVEPAGAFSVAANASAPPSTYDIEKPLRSDIMTVLIDASGRPVHLCCPKFLDLSRPRQK